MPERLVTVTLNLVELRIFRRAVAKAVDAGEIEWKAGLQRVCELMRLQHEEPKTKIRRLRQPKKPVSKQEAA
jgi:hypothetical protein